MRFVVLRWLLVAATAACAGYALLLARAQYLFQQDTAASVAAAVRLVPYNATYVARLAAWKPAERVQLLQRAVALNPFDSQSWIQLGLYSELQAKDAAAAERYYRKAAEVNHMFLPKWTLTNFYFRQGNQAGFFRSANQALAITPYSPDPVFVEMWLMQPDAAYIAAAVPNRPQTLLRYAWFLSNTGRPDAIPPIIERLVKQVSAKNAHAWGRDSLIATMEDRLAAHDNTGDALQVWAALHKAGWISQTAPDASRPLSNGDFRTAFYPHGFDWNPIESSGVSITHDTDQGSLEIELSGEQPEQVTLLQQYVPVKPGALYRLTWHAAGDDLASPSGLAWRLHPVATRSASDLASGDLLDSQHSWNVKVPGDASLCLLTLEYTRPLGSVRARGTFSISSVAMAKLAD